MKSESELGKILLGGLFGHGKDSEYVFSWWNGKPLEGFEERNDANILTGAPWLP